MDPDQLHKVYIVMAVMWFAGFFSGLHVGIQLMKKKGSK